MSTIRNNINTYADLTAYDNDANKEFPNVSYIEEDDIVLFESEVKYEEQYLAIESLVDNNTISFKASSASLTKTISISTDDGTTWTNYTSTTGGTTIATLNIGEKVLIKGNNSTYSDSSNYNYFSSTEQFDVNGNIMSLIYGDNFKEKYLFPSGTQYNFNRLFYSAPVVSAENLVLPATTLVSGCYSIMFGYCTSLTTAPELSSKTLASSCYANMFLGCTSLTTAPELPATTLASSCYSQMFNGCTSLVTAPELPATTLTSGCYQSMFFGCTSLTTAPVLPATTLVYSCYGNMFRSCTSLNYIKAMFTTTPGSSYGDTEFWVQYVSSTGTFVKNSAATWNVTGVNGIPTGWTVQTASS